MADFNGDGNADIMIGSNFYDSVTVPGSDSDTGVNVLLGNGDGTFQPEVYYTAAEYPTAVAVADFNGDGKADIVVAGQEMSVLLGNGDGTFQSAVTYSIDSNSTAIAVADLNGDGRTDVVVSRYGGGGTSGALVLLGAIPLPTTTELVSSLNPSNYGQNVKLTATVSPPTATGKVTFNQGSTSLGTAAMSEGTAALSESTLAAGEYSLTAVYGGDPNNATSTSPVLAQVVNKDKTTLKLTSSPNPSTFRRNVALTATVSPSTATGKVTFYAGSNALGTASVSAGTATLTLSTLSAGPHSLTATYSGDVNDTTSTSAALIQIVRDTTSTILTSSPNPSNLNQAVTFTALVSPSSATGSVTFYHGSTSLGTSTLSSGKATLSVSTLSAGSHAITATYNGSSIDAPSTSTILTQVVD